MIYIISSSLAKVVKIVEGHEDALCCIEANEDRVISASVDGVIKYWKYGEPADLELIDTQYAIDSSKIISIGFMKHCVVIGTNEGKIALAQHQVGNVAIESSEPISSMAFGNERFLTASHQSLWSWIIRSKDNHHTLKQENKAIIKDWDNDPVAFADERIR